LFSKANNYTKARAPPERPLFSGGILSQAKKHGCIKYPSLNRKNEFCDCNNLTIFLLDKWAVKVVLLEHKFYE
jgi:hypothetical protein